MYCLNLRVLVIILPILVAADSEDRGSQHDNSDGRSDSNESHADLSIDNQINDNDTSSQDDNEIAWKEEAKKNLDNLKAPWNQDEPILTKNFAVTMKDIIIDYIPLKITVESEEKKSSKPAATEAITKRYFETVESNKSTSISEEVPIYRRWKPQPGVTQPIYPYTVAIQKKGMFYATGTLLDNGWILTTAAEFHNIRESIRMFTARLGSTNSKYGGVSLPLRSVHAHPLYVEGRPHYDLALLKIAKPLNYSKGIQASNLSTVRSEVESAKFLITYWPRLIINGTLIPPTAKERVQPHNMRASLQRMVPWEDCYRNLSSSLLIDQSILCLRPITAHHSICSPDPGAPVVALDGLWGVTSAWTTKDCAAAPSPTLMTRVSPPAVANWIHEHLGSVTKDNA